MRAIITFLIVFACVGFSAQACKNQATPSAASIAAAPVAFVGTVLDVCGSRITFKVQKSIRGVKDGKTYEVHKKETSCGIDFATGERWLFLGAETTSNSLLLSTDTGISQQSNINFVLRETGIQEAGRALPKETAIVERTKIPHCCSSTGGAPVVTGISYFNEKEWIVWINGSKVTPQHTPKEVHEIKVEPDLVHLKWFDECLNKVFVRSIKLKNSAVMPEEINRAALPSSPAP